MSTQIKQLHRSRSGRMLGGVCAGLGDYLDIDPTVVRVGFVFASLIGWLGAIVLIYLVMWIVVPEAPGALIEEKEASPAPAGDL